MSHGSSPQAEHGPLVIRAFDDGDRAGVSALYRVAWHATYDAVDGAARIEGLITALLAGDPPELFSMPDGDAALVAERFGQIVGGIRAHPRVDGVHISGFYVLPGQQRSGVGSALFAALSVQFPRTSLRADVRPSSSAALAFYAACGFVEISRGCTDVGCGYWVDMVELRRGPSALSA